MNITKFNHHQSIGEETVIIHIIGYLSDDKRSFEIDTLKSEWKHFDESKVSDETMEEIKLKYLNIEL